MARILNSSACFRWFNLIWELLLLIVLLYLLARLKYALIDLDNLFFKNSLYNIFYDLKNNNNFIILAFYYV